MTSEWSPKIESACVASVRAATCMQNGVSSPAILYMFGIISSRPCDAVKVVDERARLQRAVHRARPRPPPTASRPPREPCPRGSSAPAADHSSASSPIVRRGRDRVDGDHLAGAVRHRRGRLVAVEDHLGMFGHGRSLTGKSTRETSWCGRPDMRRRPTRRASPSTSGAGGPRTHLYCNGDPGSAAGRTPLRRESAIMPG